MRKLSKLWDFARNYYLFFAALVLGAMGLGLGLAGYDSAAKFVLIAVILIELIPLVWDMIMDLRLGKYGVDVLAATAIITALVMGEYWAGLVIVLMLTGGQALEDFAGNRAEDELESLLKRQPKKARILRGRKEIEVNADQVKKGDKIIVKAGETVPVDALILENSASFDESSLTGESLPSVKSQGDDILSGSINLDGQVTAKALYSAADSQYQQIIKLVKSARASQAPFIRLADRYALPFTIFSFLLAGGAWAVSGDSLRFLQVLVVATPCPLILAAPIAIIAGVSRAAKQGIIMKSGAALEKLGRARTFAFDKTGTITKGELEVTKITTFGNNKEREVLKIAASLEKSSNHSLAQAIVAKAESKKIKLAKVKNVRELPGKGLTASFRGKQVTVGRLQFARGPKVKFPDGFDETNYQSTSAYIVLGNQLAGVIEFGDEIRENSKTTLSRLKELGAEYFLLVTGDHKSAAQAVADEIGISHVSAEMLPGDKIAAIKELDKRPVAFVGDGVNDAPVLASSDVGVALGARGAPAASESADVVVMLDDFSKVAASYEISKRSLSVAKQSIWVGIVLSVVLMGVYSTGKFSPVSGALIQEVVDVIVIFNALRALKP